MIATLCRDKHLSNTLDSDLSILLRTHLPRYHDLSFNYVHTYTKGSSGDRYGTRHSVHELGTPVRSIQNSGNYP